MLAGVSNQTWEWGQVCVAGAGHAMRHGRDTELSCHAMCVVAKIEATESIIIISQPLAGEVKRHVMSPFPLEGSEGRCGR